MIQKREIGFFLMLFGYVIAVIAIAYMMLFTTGCTGQKGDAEQPLKCVAYGTILKRQVLRCEDQSAICYLWNNGLSCVKKSRLDQLRSREDEKESALHNMRDGRLPYPKKIGPQYASKK